MIPEGFRRSLRVSSAVSSFAPACKILSRRRQHGRFALSERRPEWRQRQATTRAATANTVANHPEGLTGLQRIPPLGLEVHPKAIADDLHLTLAWVTAPSTPKKALARAWRVRHRFPTVQFHSRIRPSGDGDWRPSAHPTRPTSPALHASAQGRWRPAPLQLRPRFPIHYVLQRHAHSV